MPDVVEDVPAALAPDEQAVVDAFHQLYYQRVNLHNAFFYGYWLGRPIAKPPWDLWTYQELLWDTRPTLIIETGTYYGGSALYFATLLDAVGGPGVVVTIDTHEALDLVAHPRITYLRGDSRNPRVLELIRERFRRQLQRVMVVLDADHRVDCVRAELDLYAPLVSHGCYLVVEDTNIGGRPVVTTGPGYEKDQGPAQAVEEFLAARPGQWLVDRSRERHLLSFNPGGWLKRL